MSRFVEAKADFLRDACQQGWTQLSEVSEAWQAQVPPKVLAKWLRSLGEVIEVDPLKPQRLLNHFKLGADPEFSFLRSTDGARESAQSLGLKAALAWGADNNGRLAEIRPEPSRHVLEVVASIWSTLQWMGKINPTTLGYIWRSGAWYASDGMGGHIHFGRKRPTWPREITALDTLAFWLQHVNILNQGEWRERIRRTRGHGNYGQMSDRRPQAHGWEYRSLPSWLDSPWLAYTILTLSKLAVFDPEFIPPLMGDADQQSASAVRAKLKGLLSYYKSRDDDAALAFQIQARLGWPRFDQTDFKAHWGIFNSPNAPYKPANYTIPGMIPASPQSLGEIASAMLEGRVPEWAEQPPTWKPAMLPEGYTQVLNCVETYHRPGLGEIFRDLVISQKAPVNLRGSDNSRVDIPNTWMPKTKGWLGGIAREFPALDVHGYTPDSSRRGEQGIFIPGEYARQPDSLAQVVGFLTSGWAPIWRAEDVRSDSLAIFLAAQEAQPGPAPIERRPVSRVLWPLDGAAVKKKRTITDISREVAPLNNAMASLRTGRMTVTAPGTVTVSNTRNAADFFDTAPISWGQAQAPATQRPTRRGNT